MEISFLGLDHASFKIKGKNATVICAPANLKIDDFVINGPGEYEVKGVTVLGFAVSSDHTVYNLTVDGVRICFLGSFDQKISQEQIGKIGEVDILLLPTATDEVVTQLEPKIVIPMKGKPETASVPKLNISADKLPETTTVVVLE